MTIKVTGLKELTNQLDTVARAAKSLDGELCTIAFDPKNRSSIDDAIRTMEAAIDRKVARYSGNPLVAHFSKQLKESYRRQILLRAAAS